jgi:alkylated DNA repair dioxygenase AlkB
VRNHNKRAVPDALEDAETTKKTKTEDAKLVVRHIILDTYLHLNFFDREEADSWLQALNADITYLPREKLLYRGNNLARDKQFFCDIFGDSTAFYQYPGSQRGVWRPWSVKTRELRDVLRIRTGQKSLNSLVANAYQGGDDKIGRHFDKPEDIQRGTAIVTACFGSTRTLRLERIDGKGNHTDIPLPHGSLFVLGWETNQLYTHEILATTAPVGLRLGLTYRTLASRWLPKEKILIRQPKEGEERWAVASWPDGRAKRPLFTYLPLSPDHLVADDITAVLQRVERDR